MADHDPAETEALDPADVAAAEALDAEIDSILAGTVAVGAAPTLTWLTAAVRTDPPPSLQRRIEAAEETRLRRRWRPFRYAAAALAYLFISQGIGNLVVGEWVARGIGEAYSPHVMREGAFALIAAGLAVAAGAVSRRMTTVSVVAGTPLGLGLGAFGITEIGVFTAGAVLHLTEGAVAIFLAYAFWRLRRDTSPFDDEEGP